MSSTLTKPTVAEIDAGEKVLAEEHGCNPDGYYRPSAEAVLEAGKEAALKELTGIIDREIEDTERLIKHFRGSPMDRVGALDLELAGEQAFDRERRH